MVVGTDAEGLSYFRSSAVQIPRFPNAALSVRIRNTAASPRPPSLLSITENIWIDFRRSGPAEQKVSAEAAAAARATKDEQRNATLGC